MGKLFGSFLNEPKRVQPVLGKEKYDQLKHIRIKNFPSKEVKTKEGKAENEEATMLVGTLVMNSIQKTLRALHNH